MDAYYNLLIGSDYRDRPMGKIMALREAWGLPGVYTTQDVMHTLACLLTGGIKLCSYARLGKYIGARGLHIDEATYESAGFGKIELYPNKLEDFGPVTNELVNWCREVHCRFTGVKEALCQQ
jgi:hypothetical protein